MGLWIRKLNHLIDWYTLIYSGRVRVFRWLVALRSSLTTGRCLLMDCPRHSIGRGTQTCCTWISLELESLLVILNIPYSLDSMGESTGDGAAADLMDGCTVMLLGMGPGTRQHHGGRTQTSNQVWFSILKKNCAITVRRVSSWGCLILNVTAATKFSMLNATNLPNQNLLMTTCTA